MKLLPFLLTIALLPTAVFADTTEQDRSAAFRALDWHVGPKDENVAGKAMLKTSEGHIFLDEANSRKFLELTGNIPENGNYVLYSEDAGWWATFSFDPAGYVKDGETIDADALLSQLKEADAYGNEQRKQLGIPALYTEGWYIPPHYDTTTKHLEWGLRLSSEGETVLNYTIRLLGRTGVMSATLVSSPDKLDADVRSFKTALNGFEYNAGERYAEFKAGDHVAEFGLAALIAGGAAAVATKKGFWAVLAASFAAAWKFIAVAFIGVLAWVRNLFKKKR